MSEEIEKIHAFYTAMVHRNASLIRWLCMRQAGGDKALCDDLVQEVLLGLWLHLDSYRRGLPEKVWIRWKTRTILYDYRRRHLPPPEQLALEVAESLAEETCHARESLEELTAYLTDEERALVENQLKGFSHAEIAQQLGISTNAVHKQMHKIKKKMVVINGKLKKRGL